MRARTHTRRHREDMGLSVGADLRLSIRLRGAHFEEATMYRVY